ncbi:MAG: LamG-like jellyroll fold domain-containing protein [Planctomycetota bacterium]|nr:LamG-like jellyroll fold domain-containing protein [Planctomycetota bacterium]
MLEADYLYPEDGYDTNWDLATDGPLPVPTWMMDDRHPEGFGAYDVVSGEFYEGYPMSPSYAHWETEPQNHVFYLKRFSMGQFGHLDLPSNTIGNGVPGTYSVWARVNYASAKRFMFGVFGSGSYSYPWHGRRFQLFGTATTLLWTADTNFYNRMRHYVIVADGSGFTLYLDGKSQGRQESSDAFSVNNFGSQDLSYQYGWEGNFSRIVQFDEALSDSQVSLLYESQLNGGLGVLGESWPLHVRSPVAAGGASHAGLVGGGLF